MRVIASFVAGFILAQSAWWYAARSAMSAAALGSESTFRFLMVAGAEILISAIAFGVVVALVSKGRAVAVSFKSCFVAFVAGATTSTVAAGPYALVPRIVAGEAQLLVYIGVAILVSSAFGALVAVAFRER